MTNRVAFALVAVLAVQAAASAQAPNPAAALIDRYAAGDYDGAVQSYLSSPNFGLLRKEFERRAGLGTDTGTPAARQRQRVIAATFALDVASRFLWPEDVDPLVELGCKLLSGNDTGDAATELWYRTSVAVFVRTRDDGQLVTRAGPGSPVGSLNAPAKRQVNHVAHAQKRFPTEPRFQLAAAELVAATADSEPPRDADWVPTNVLDKRTPEAQRRTRAQEAIARFEVLRANSDLQPEADLRIGYLRFTLHEPTAALESYARARRSGDPFIAYLAVFLSGRALDHLKRPAEALEQYRDALTIVPGAQSATNALAASLFLAGKPDDAYALVADALSAQPKPDDPWHYFGYGDLRLIPAMLGDLRAAIR
ncbi:MAG TPA: hypothetical protein VFV98_03725 [Vicinamibacterales bacterium]|nr:hypothetical protein [Vicinamibacterales bacterium]